MCLAPHILSLTLPTNVRPLTSFGAAKLRLAAKEKATPKYIHLFIAFLLLFILELKNPARASPLILLPTRC
jgi:hypothetical protein